MQRCYPFVILDRAFKTLEDQFIQKGNILYPHAATSPMMVVTVSCGGKKVIRKGEMRLDENIHSSIVSSFM